MKVLVTGGAGFIGSNLVDYLAKQEEVTKIVVIDNLSHSKIENLNQHLDQPYFEFHQIDLLDFPKVKEVMVQGFDIVFHLAANPDAQKGFTDTKHDLEQETIVTYNVLESMRLTGVKKVVLSSSGTIYGETPVIPLPENYGPCFPISMYGAGKLAAEGLVTGFSGTFGFNAWIFRFANVVGQRRINGVVSDFIRKLRSNPKRLEILGDGKQQKPYILVDDLVEAIWFCVNQAQDPINVFNLGVASSTTVTKIAQIVAEELNLPEVEFSYTGGERGWPGDIPQVRYDVSKVNRLGWKAKFESDEAVREAAKQLSKEIV